MEKSHHIRHPLPGMGVRVLCPVVRRHTVREHHPRIRPLVSTSRHTLCIRTHNIPTSLIHDNNSCVYRFNYRATAYMVEHGFYNFLNWFDERAWYPLGRIVGGTVYPGLMVTSGAIHHILHALNIPVHIRDICVFLAPIFR